MADFFHIKWDKEDKISVVILSVFAIIIVAGIMSTYMMNGPEISGQVINKGASDTTPQSFQMVDTPCVCNE